MAHELLDDPLDHLNHVELALLEVRIVELLELRDQMLHLLHQGPFRIAAPLPDEGLGTSTSSGSTRNIACRSMKADSSAGACSAASFIVANSSCTAATAFFKRATSFIHHARGYGQVGHFQGCMGHQESTPDSDAPETPRPWRGSS